MSKELVVSLLRINQLQITNYLLLSGMFKL